MESVRIIVSGGGTGGHVFPAIAIANAVRAIRPETEFLFVGANGRIEMEKVPQAGYKIEGLNVAGFQRRMTLKNLSFPFKLVGSVIRATSIVNRFKPHVAVGTGGYASGPVLRAAQWKGISTVIQEQNSFPGVTNRLLGKNADRICVAFENMEQYFPASRIVITGNPIRENIVASQISTSDGRRHFDLDPAKPTLFITGGSLGAGVINEAIAAGLEQFSASGIQLIWQTGKGYIDKYRHLESKNVRVLDFIGRMDAAYAAADVIVSRAGGTISELCVIGKPAILLPSPNVAEDHQTKNVAALVEKKAAVLIKDSEAADKLANEILSLMQSSERKAELSKNIKAMARPDAAKNIALEVLSLIK